MSDDEWKESVRKIDDPVEMLRWIVENEQFFGFDPYYRDLRQAMVERAKEIVESTTVPS